MELYISIEKRLNGRFHDLVEFTNDEDFILFVFTTWPDEFARIMSDIYSGPDNPFESTVKGSYVDLPDSQYVIARHWWLNKALWVEEPDSRLVVS